ncbi:MAG: hypothetical protein KDK51_01475 [Deltaproteobacteria bacterium]|nr:hypothetical protein [Deltaproteobacteria bacterium]
MHAVEKKPTLSQGIVLKQVFLSVVLLASMLQFVNFTDVEEKQIRRKYLQSGFGSIQDVKYAQKALSKYLSVDLAQFKTFKQDFGATQLQDTLEAKTQMVVSYQVKNSLSIHTQLGFTYSKQDISTVSSIETNDTRHEKMLYGSMGLDKYFLHDSKLNFTLGMVRAKNYSSGQINLYPTAALTYSHMIKSANVAFSLASQAIGGGSFTGLYGNQMLHHAKLAFAIPVTEKFGLQSDIAMGQTRDAFVGSQKANIMATSVKVNYTIHENVEFGFGIYNRQLTNDQNFQNPVKEGMMYMASMKVSYF